VRLLLDTQVVLWVAIGSRRLSAAARTLIEDSSNALYFSAASIWEIALKSGRGRVDFAIEASDLRESLLRAGYLEVPVTGDHAVGVGALPALHKDPFDRLLLAQANVEGMILVTGDRQLAKYPGPVRKV
jgi:PIN domain nuclease of toxin-antitoxin system